MTSRAPLYYIYMYVCTFTYICVCVCVFVACWLSNDISGSCCRALLYDYGGKNICFLHMAEAQLEICSILFRGFVLLGNPLHYGEIAHFTGNHTFLRTVQINEYFDIDE